MCAAIISQPLGEYVAETGPVLSLSYFTYATMSRKALRCSRMLLGCQVVASPFHVIIVPWPIEEDFCIGAILLFLFSTEVKSSIMVCTSLILITIDT
jgi:hypothetical protein